MTPYILKTQVSFEDPRWSVAEWCLLHDLSRRRIVSLCFLPYTRLIPLGDQTYISLDTSTRAAHIGGGFCREAGLIGIRSVDKDRGRRYRKGSRDGREFVWASRRKFCARGQTGDRGSCWSCEQKNKRLLRAGLRVKEWAKGERRFRSVVNGGPTSSDDCRSYLSVQRTPLEALSQGQRDGFRGREGRHLPK